VDAVGASYQPQKAFEPRQQDALVRLQVKLAAQPASTHTTDSKEVGLASTLRGSRAPALDHTLYRSRLERPHYGFLLLGHSDGAKEFAAGGPSR